MEHGKGNRLEGTGKSKKQMKPIPREKLGIKRTKGAFDAGERQFLLAVKYGLTKDTKYLDIGCGDLRGGVHVIANIKSGNYYGVNPKLRSPWGKHFDSYVALLENMGIKDKQIDVRINEVFEYVPIKYDMIMAWSLFTHLNKEQIRLCLKNTAKVMHDDTKWLVTWFDSPYITNNGKNCYRYPFSYLHELANLYGLFAVRKNDFIKVNQSLMMIRKKNNED